VSVDARAGDALPTPRGTVAQRARAGLVSVASSVACRLPEGPLIRLAELAGDAWYRVDRRRAERGRRNLRRVCEWLAAEGLGPERARAAASEPSTLEALLRSAFRHQARYYLEVALTPSMTRAYLRERLAVETPDAVAEAFAAPGPVIFVGLHFGAIELPALFLADRTDRVGTAPMETIDDPPLQRWFARTRGAVGVRIVGLREARRELLAALRRGEPVGLVADRDLTGGGIETTLFGHPAPLPVGPALLALESGAPVYLAAVRRAGRGRYRGRLERLAVPADGTRRERVTTFLAAEAAAFERAIATAPDQWWAVFFPIWPDLGSPTVVTRDR
jgi:KDO2-lipid IV(A) lauroyltransferase